MPEKNVEPFSRERYDLSSCTLGALTDREAEPLSGALASLDPWRTLGYSPEALLRYLVRTDPALRRYAVRVSGETAGVICVRSPWLCGPCLELIALLPPCQGRGIGRTLLLWMETEARRISKNLWTVVSGFNTSARHFYCEMGFLEAASLPDLIQSGFSEILLRKRLDA